MKTGAPDRIRTCTRSGVASAYGYDSVSRPTSLTDDLAGTADDVITTLAYNPASQITSKTRSNNGYAFTGYVSVSRSYVVNGLNQYTTGGGATFIYDANGNLTSDGTSSYTYDVENRLTSRSGGLMIAYDPSGRLWQTSGAASGTTRYLYDGDELAAEYDGAGQVLRRYVHGTGEDDPILWYEGSGLGDRRSLQIDQQGSIVSIANATGGRIAIDSYDEYGIPGASNIGRFQYTGQAWLSDLGMYYYKARIYSPTLGRFLQTDPVGYDDQVNLYAYVENDPIDGRDPTGENTGSLVSGQGTGCESELSPCSTTFGDNASSSYRVAKKTTSQPTPGKADAQEEDNGIDIDKIAKYIDSHARARSHGRCAAYCRRAMEAGGVDTRGHPGDAKGYGPLLKRNGWAVVSKKDYEAQKGDVVVFGGNKAHPHGHIAFYDGSAWVSDFKQKHMSPYRKSRPPSTIYRYDDE